MLMEVAKHTLSRRLVAKTTHHAVREYAVSYITSCTHFSLD